MDVDGSLEFGVPRTLQRVVKIVVEVATTPCRRQKISGQIKIERDWKWRHPLHESCIATGRVGRQWNQLDTLT